MQDFYSDDDLKDILSELADEQGEEEGVEDVEEGFVQGHEEALDAQHDASPVEEIMALERGDGIGEVRDMLACLPYQGIVVVIPVQGHQSVQEEHDAEDGDEDKQSLSGD